ncbi:MAG TPA: TetR/AcrR family transcriptional regulator [Aliidongia sp.]|uniref:TetR/AcrR family transcriptional regulator n=1 Tax=Aliidongia sp. TaxID=1914230 RepID=UPI002DDCE61D|nr:TetR/AcrR family transcriptional regulator [Aliidongia sp.]HEV2677937.1 TetR/AcrR family transcriptional regulator [Aliidongia sp.]
MTSRRQPAGLNPRKSPAQSRAVETVAAVLEAAARILEERGFAGYTTNAVAERAGVSIGSLYQYFPGKDALMVALIERETATLLADIAKIPPGIGLEARLGQMIRAGVTHQMRRPVLAVLLDFEERRLPLGARDERVADQIHRMLIDTLAAEGLPATGDRTVAAQDLLAITRGMIDAAGERGEIDAHDLERRVARALFGYLGREPPA